MVVGKESMYFGVSDGYTYKVDSTIFSDDGNPITIKIRTKYDTGDGKRSTVKTFNEVVCFGDFPQQAKILYSLRTREKMTDYKQLKTTTQDTERFQIMDKGTAISFGIDETSAKKFEWEGYDLEFKVEKEKI